MECEMWEIHISLATSIETLHGNHDTYDDEWVLFSPEAEYRKRREMESGTSTLRPSKVNKSSVSQRGIQKF